MKKLFLMGRSEAGKTSLTQALKGEELHYEKTQYTITADDTIDSPGEYAESKQFGAGLECFSFEADVVGIVQADRHHYQDRFPLCQCSYDKTVAFKCRLRSYFSCK